MEAAGHHAAAAMEAAEAAAVDEERRRAGGAGEGAFQHDRVEGQVVALERRRRDRHDGVGDEPSAPERTEMVAFGGSMLNWSSPARQFSTN